MGEGGEEMCTYLFLFTSKVHSLLKAVKRYDVPSTWCPCKVKRKTENFQYDKYELGFFYSFTCCFCLFFFKKSVRRSLFQPRRPRGSQSGREKGRDESFQVRAKEPNTKDYFSWEPEKINVKFYKNCENRGNILNTSYVRSHFGKFDICFLGLPREIVFAVITDNRSYN